MDRVTKKKKKKGSPFQDWVDEPFLRCGMEAAV